MTRALTLGAALLVLSPLGLQGQGLAEYDYENLAFRGFSLEGGHIFPTRVERAYTVGARMDLGYLGPGLRIVPGIAYWSSTLRREEVAGLERKVEALIARELPPSFPSVPPVSLGRIDWSDLVLSLDGHLVWSVPFNLLSFAGGGVSAHILNGEGEAISGTFVEDLLDTVRAGLNFHGGLEYPLHRQFRLYGLARYEILEDLRYLELRFGGQIMLGPAAPGELRGER